MGKTLKQHLEGYGGYVPDELTDCKGRIQLTVNHLRAKNLARRDHEATPYSVQAIEKAGFDSSPMRLEKSAAQKDRIVKMVARNSTLCMEVLALAVCRGMGVPQDAATIAISATYNCMEQVRYIKTKEPGSHLWSQVVYEPAYLGTTATKASCDISQLQAEACRLEKLRKAPAHDNNVMLARAFFNLLGVAPTMVELVQEVPFPSDKNPAFKFYYRRRESTGSRD